MVPKYDTGISSRPRSKRSPKPYNKKPYDKRGLVERESRSVRGFWSNHTMDQIIQLSPEELEQVIDNYLEKFIAAQLKVNRHWNFPEAIDRKRI